MCWWIRKDPVIIEPPQPIPESLPDVSLTQELPHSEESENPLITIDNMDLTGVFNKWFKDWAVPIDFLQLWSGMRIEFDPSNPYGAGCCYWWEIPPRVVFMPSWYTPGALGHEFGHVDYFNYLTLEQQEQFSEAYQRLMKTDLLLQAMLAQKQYVRDNFGVAFDVEGHAECFRYLGNKMPDELKKFYPHLI